VQWNLREGIRYLQFPYEFLKPSLHPQWSNRMFAGNVRADAREAMMQDAIFLALTLFFFLISLAYMLFCERMR
jgi:hypothetical protein